MTMTAPIPTIHRHDLPMPRTSYVHGIDGVVANVAVAMLKWSHDREARATLNHAEHSRRRQAWNSEQAREVAALRLTQRLGL
ncbi:MAG: hypothetical protein KF739_05745 [Cryobacterium sp.]|nr:hypothetical protein [Cryobacterium sp.]